MPRTSVPDRPAPDTTSRLAIDPSLAAFFRPFAPDVIEAIVDGVRRSVDAYGPQAGEEYLAVTRLTIGQAVMYFIDHIANPELSRAELDETLRLVGRGEAYEGRSLESFLAALRVGIRVADEQVAALLESLGQPPAQVRGLVREITAFIESLEGHAILGFREAQDQLSDAVSQWRHRLLDLILAGEDPAGGDGRELRSLAAAGNYALPEQVALVAVRQAPGRALPAARMLRRGALADLHTERPVVLLPAPLSGAGRAELATLFVGHRIAIGCDVPLERAASSLRWARRALDLVDSGALPDEPVVDCTRHIAALWIHSEPLLADIVERTVLAPLYAEPPHSRRILGETLLAWIETRGASAPTLAAVLDKHPQTVRYRLKRLRSLLGPVLDQPDRVTEIHYALRAGESRWRSGTPGPDTGDWE